MCLSCRRVSITLNNRVKSSIVEVRVIKPAIIIRLSVVETTIETSAILTTVIDKEITKTKASFFI